MVGALDGGETATVVTHSGPVRAVLAAVSGRDLASLAETVSPSNCGVTTVAVADGSLSVVARDVTDYRSA